MQKRIIVLTLISVVVILLSLGIISNLSINSSINQSLAERLESASIIANYTDYLLQSNLMRLYDISLSGAINFKDDDWSPEMKTLRTAYQYSIFTDGIFLSDIKGDIVLTYPPQQIPKRNLMGIPYVRKTLDEKKSVISSIYTFEDTKRKVIFVLVPLKDKDGNIIGVAGGEINPTNYILNNVIRSVPTGASTIIELVDSYGVVIASNNPSRIFACSDRNEVLGRLIAAKKKAVMECHRCHGEGGSTVDVRSKKTTDMLAFSPLAEAPWGISVREPERIVFSPSSDLKKKFLILGIISMVSALVLAVGLSRSIVNPVKSLISATRRISGGDLRGPIRVSSKDEIGVLSYSFDAMRVKLSESLEKIQKSNIELEKRVAERTRELEQNKKMLAKFLHEVIRAQEEERKRIARELHDETSQSIAALGMSLEIASVALRENKLAPESIYELRQKASQLLDGMNRLIQDLRPPVLDDLGLESAVRWLLERHLAGKGVKYHLEASDEFNKKIAHSINEKTELTLFRVIQEVIVNIAKHAEASSVSVYLSCSDSHMKVDIMDNGVGFDVGDVLGGIDGGINVGYGILGLRERVSLLDGTLWIDSRPGEGTRITVSIPTSAFAVESA